MRNSQARLLRAEPPIELGQSHSARSCRTGDAERAGRGGPLRRLQALVHDVQPDEPVVWMVEGFGNRGEDLKTERLP